jgi:hypothetical protein
MCPIFGGSQLLLGHTWPFGICTEHNTAICGLPVLDISVGFRKICRTCAIFLSMASHLSVSKVKFLDTQERGVGLLTFIHLCTSPWPIFGFFFLLFSLGRAVQVYGIIFTKRVFFLFKQVFLLPKKWHPKFITRNFSGLFKQCLSRWTNLYFS